MLCWSVLTIGLEMASQLQPEYKQLLAAVRYSKSACSASKRSPVSCWWMSGEQTLKVTSVLADFELNGEGGGEELIPAHP